MRRIILMLTVALVVTLMGTSALPAFADVRRGGDDVPIGEGRDLYWDEMLDGSSADDIIEDYDEGTFLSDEVEPQNKAADERGFSVVRP